jgi:carboxyl-terminal processing protease
VKGKATNTKLHVALAVALALAISAVLAAATPRTSSPYHKLSIFARVLTHVERSYVDKIEEDEIIVGAIKGMVRTLDPHSSFLTPEEFKILQADTRGRFGGVGLEVGVRDDVLTVIAPIDGSPAAEAGIEPGDQIVAIEGRSTRTMSIDEAVQIMRGETGTEVTITIRRPGKTEPLEVTLARREIEVESVKAQLVAPGYPRVWVRGFQDGTAADIEDAIERLTLEGGGLEGVVLDLRRNPGGLLEEAVRVADLFIVKGMIASTRGRDEIVLQEFHARERGTMAEVPMVVLIDGASASAAEIVAGAIQDHGRGLLVGMPTFGKGSVQSIIPLNQGAGLKLTVALYYTPLGRSIQAEGVTPDVIVESRRAPEPDDETRLLEEAPDESDLPGHLEGGNGDSPATEEDEPEIDDFQLRVAFQVLRGLVRADAAKKTDE